MDDELMNCPKCGCTGQIVITALADVRLVQHDVDEFETEPVDNNHEWHDESPARCTACGFKGVVMNFDPEGRDGLKPSAGR